jgi:hypothetical protein
MCRSLAEGGRRCPGGHADNADAQRARQRLCRARRSLATAQAEGDTAAITVAQERVAEAEDGVVAVRILAGADQPDEPNSAGLRRAERTAVSVYAGGEFGAINSYVENGYAVPTHAASDREHVRYMRRTVAALKRTVDRSPLRERTAAVRAIPSATMQVIYGPVGSMVGQTITENRFTSSTRNATPDKTFGDGVVRYDLAPGTKALDINGSGVPSKQDENELLIGPHQDYIVVSDKMVVGQRVTELRSAALGPAAG